MAPLLQMSNRPLIVHLPESGCVSPLAAAARRRYADTKYDYARFLGDAIDLHPTRLSGFSHLLASRQGLYAIGLTGFVKISSGQFFGMTLRDSALYCFESLGPSLAPLPHFGRIVRFDIVNETIEAATVVAKGLPNGCHQMDFIGCDLFVCDTHNTRILRFDGEFTNYRTYLPFGQIQFQDFAAGYPHLNSIVGHGGDVYVMLHNYTAQSGVSSQIAIWQPESGQVTKTLTVDGGGCHNIVFLEDGKILFCNTDGGALTCGRRTVAQFGRLLTRGLSVDSDMVVVGSSLFALRDSRKSVTGEVWFLDRQYRQLARFVVPAAPTEIRKIDERDFSITNYRFIYDIEAHYAGAGRTANAASLRLQ